MSNSLGDTRDGKAYHESAPQVGTCAADKPRQQAVWGASRLVLTPRT